MWCLCSQGLTSANKKTSALGATPTTTASSSGWSYQAHRELLPGNRRAQGYRPQGPKSSDPTNQGQHYRVGRYRNSSWYSSASRYQSAPPQAPGNTSERGQAHAAGTNGTGASMEPSPPKPSFIKGLPQHKPRTSQPDVVNSWGKFQPVSLLSHTIQLGNWTLGNF